jgi:hypothetical protein
MKPVSVASLVLAVSVCAALTAQTQSSRSPAERSSADSKAREVSFRNASPAGSAEPAVTVSAVIFGSIGTAATGGAPVQVFTRRTDVFLTAGPTATPCFFPAYLSDGKYYFQVTDPSGRTLLSTDPVAERAFTVKGGVIASYDGTTHATDGKTACGSLAIALSPYNDAGARKALYIVWVTPAAGLEGTPTQVDPVCGTSCFHGFRADSSLTAAFRVEDKPSCDDSFCISGTAFNDANGNGVRDTGEGGLPGVPIKVENATGLVLTGLTSADGSFQICGLASGEDFKVTSPVPLGFNQTGPLGGVIAQRLFAKDFAYIIQVCTNNVPNLLFPNQPIPGSIGGLKFQDTNANGARDPGEPPLAGVTIRLTPSAGGSAQTTVTAADGSFLFTSLSAGTYLLSENVPFGFTQTVPASGGITVVLPANGSSVSNVFGNFNGILTGTISGTKFNDLNGNGVRDPGEPGMAGIFFSLMGCPSPCAQPPVGGTTTAADGSFSLTGIPFGTYFLSETPPVGFRQTVPITRELPVTLDFGHQTVTGLLFGNQAIGGSISGIKFNDLNGNGVRDAGEAGVSGVTIQVRNSAGALSGTAQTDASGNFTVSGLQAGTYKVSEVLTSGFAQTTPGGDGTITVTLVSGQAFTGALFGNQVATASISGSKFNDANGNGVRDAGEAGVAGITINLAGPNGLTRTTTSDASGNFSFSSLPAGAFILSEVVPAGSTQTTPGGAGTIAVTLAAGQTASGFLFGNRAAAGTASIAGTKFLDINANGIVDGLDRPFQGITITLKDSSGNTQTTVSGTDGTFKFSNLAPGTYTLSEVIPPGFAQTFPGTPDVPKSFTITLTAGQQATGFIFLNKC